MCGKISGTQNPPVYTCAKTVKSKGQIPIKCTNIGTDECIGESGDASHTVSNLCRCSNTSDGTAYCGLFPGDPLGQKYYAQLKKWFASGLGAKCNTVRRESFNCIKSQWNENDYYNLVYLFFSYSDFYRM
jgi:hypothetical protein